MLMLLLNMYVNRAQKIKKITLELPQNITVNQYFQPSQFVLRFLRCATIVVGLLIIFHFDAFLNYNYVKNQKREKKTKEKKK